MKMNRELTRIDANKNAKPAWTQSAGWSISGSVAIDRAAVLGVLAKQALIAEAELTPKPGLVDRRGSGAHTDLSLDIMRRSAFAIEPFIRHMGFQAMYEQPSARLRTKLAATGRAAERAMLQATNGSNTHKGAIWTLGLLTAAAAINQSGRTKLDAAVIARTAAVIASFEDSDHEWTRINTNGHRLQTPSHGQVVAQKFEVTGARGEAISGFPHIVEVGLPILRARRRDHGRESIARLDALLSIMSRLDDTCLLYRGGKEALQAAKQGATAVIDAGGAGSLHGQKCLFALDKRLLELGVSPGGSADLLAGTIFLDAIERQQTEIPASPAIPSVLPDEQKLVQPWSLTIFERSKYPTPRTSENSPTKA
jgi:triphosphoribosyl-dephospho-CoA synthase